MSRQAMIDIPFKNASVPVYITCQDEDKARPTVILIHEVWGLTDHIKGIADRLCQGGFMVLAPDLLTGTEVEKNLKPELQKIIFDEKERLKHQVEIRAMWAPLRSPEFAQQTVQKLETCFDYLLSQDKIGKIGVMGFCFGGTYSFNLAIAQAELACAVPFYGHFEHSDQELERIMCPIMAFYGEKDTTLTEDLTELEKRMNKARKDFSYKVYPNCGHAFFNNTNPLTYNKDAAEDSWNRALSFLNQHLS